jgi:hypothetical protein
MQLAETSPRSIIVPCSELVVWCELETIEFRILGSLDRCYLERYRIPRAFVAIW